MLVSTGARDDASIPYMERTREYYLALGYGNPYRWARYDEAPFAPLTKPLGASRLALITTAAPQRPDAGDQGPGAKLNAASKFYRVYSVPVDTPPDLRIAHVSYDRVHTAARDPNTWLPLARLREAVAVGRVGALTARIHGAPTNRSQRTTVERDAPELLQRCREDGADVVLLVPT
ncbi:MAG TPA: glycine/sarcosine/betaine reductase selenoprotein B family protein [Thermomicrobiales bacterium]|nr:glycine/sarcosine/betaine reductase selenoprotein B family protein [Thermomicrobiales bacterium]